MPERLYIFECDRCGLLHFYRSDLTNGFGTYDDGSKLCYNCIAQTETEEMIKTGRAVLYLGYENKKPAYLGNWPGSLRFDLLAYSVGRHNWWGVKRFDLWFIGPDGEIWYGRHLAGDVSGDLTQCRRTSGQGSSIAAQIARRVLPHHTETDPPAFFRRIQYEALASRSETGEWIVIQG